MQDELPELNEWIVRFINLPAEDQIDFLFRFSLERDLREKIEKKIFDSNFKSNNP